MLAVFLILAVSGCALLSCGSEPPPQQPAQPVPVAPPQPAPLITAVPVQPTAPATLSRPAGLAFPCQSEAQCLAHRCNFEVGQCVWPCQTNNDCQPGFQCIPPACLPQLTQ